MLLKVFINTGCDILLCSLGFSQCLRMQRQDEISIKVFLDVSKEIPNIRKCQIYVPCKGERCLYSMQNVIDKNMPTSFTKNVLCRYVGLEPCQFKLFGLDDYSLSRQIDLIMSLETALDSPSVNFHQLNLFRSPFMPNLEI